MSADELGFRPLRKDERTPWSKVSRFSFLDQLERVPLADSELLQTSHYLPILIERRGSLLDVVAGVSASLQRQPLVDGDQRWLRFYLPLFFKCLPFTLGTPVLSVQEQLRILVSERLAGVVEGETPNGMFDQAGTPTRALTEQVALLKRLQVGICKLREAAEMLYLADVLMPIDVPFRDGGEVLVVDAEKLGAFSSGRCAPLVRGGLLSSQLLFAMLFSRRMLSGSLGVSVHRSAEHEPDQARAVARPQDQFSALFSGLENLDFAMDESDLIPIEPLSEARE